MAGRNRGRRGNRNKRGGSNKMRTIMKRTAQIENLIPVNAKSRSDPKRVNDGITVTKVIEVALSVLNASVFDFGRIGLPGRYQVADAITEDPYEWHFTNAQIAACATQQTFGLNTATIVGVSRLTVMVNKISVYGPIPLESGASLYEDRVDLTAHTSISGTAASAVYSKSTSDAAGRNHRAHCAIRYPIAQLARVGENGVMFVVSMPPPFVEGKGLPHDKSVGLVQISCTITLAKPV